jgi:hypothetical protein
MAAVGQDLLRFSKGWWNMNTCFKNSLIVAVVASLSLATSAMAQSYLDGSSKMRGDYGQMSRSVMTSRPTYTATAPAQTRSFSYEPSQSTPAPAPVANGCGCGGASSDQAATPAPTAQRDTGTVRSFSYEPSIRVNSAPAARAQTPAYLVPKSLR